MSIIFGSARIDENGNSHGGAAGDQGSEVSTQTFYMHSKGWVILRAKSDDVASKLATAMQDACDNQHIGYDQYERDTLLTQYKKYGSIKAVATNCECDCSSLVRVCIYQASGTLLGDFNTESEPNTLVNSGLFEKKTCSGSSSVLNGDVLCTPVKGHTGIIVSGAPRSSSGTTSSTGSGTTGSTGSGTTSSSSKLTVDGQIGKNTVTKLQKVMGTTQDGFIDGQPSASKKYWTSIISSVCKWSGGSSEVVKALQKYLNDKGYSCGSVDGLLGTKTAKALQNYLIKQGYSCGSTGADGYFGTNSAKALQNWLNTK